MVFPLCRIWRAVIFVIDNNLLSNIIKVEQCSRKEIHMGKSENIKEKIINATIELLQKSDGNIENITIRNIAEIVGIGTGLINYHFGSKDKLIEVCVQRIIGNVITVFRPKIDEESDKICRLKEAAKQVIDFLMANPEISKVSIVGDMAMPMIMDNTMKAVMGFMGTLNTEEKEMKSITYCFTLVLQGLFLRKDIAKSILSFDFNNKMERDAFIDFIIDRMYGGNTV